MKPAEQWAHEYEHDTKWAGDVVDVGFIEAVQSDVLHCSPSPVNELKTGLPCSTWFYTQEVWAYRGTLPVVIQFGKTTPEHMVEPYHVSGCPPCESLRLNTQFPGRKVKRWMILNP